MIPKNKVSKSMGNYHVIDAVLYQHLVTGNSNGFKEIISSSQVDVLKLKHTRDKNNVLHIAASFGHLHLVTFILSQWPQLMIKANIQGELPIHSALKTSKLVIVDALTSWLQAEGKDVVDQVLPWSTKGKKNMTLLHIALEFHDHEHQIFRDLVDLYPIASYAMNKEGICPLYLAIKKEFADLVRYMLEKLLPFKQDAVRCFIKGKSLLHAAISAKRTDILEDILSFDDVDLLKSMDKQGQTALSYAAYMGYHEQVRILLSAVPHSAFISNKDKSFPIHQAVIGGHISVINLLLPSSSFLLNAIGQNILHVSVLAANLGLVTHILNSIEVESLINQKDEDGNTPLQLVKKLTLVNDRDIRLVSRLSFVLERATRGLKSIPIDDYLYQLLLQGDLNQVCQFISDRRFELNDLICSEDGCNVLHVAASMDQPLLVVDLLRRNCDTLMYLANYKGDLPHHSAAKASNLQSLKALLEWPNISVVDACRTLNDKGNTALHIAVFNNHLEMAKYLYNKCQQAAYCLNKDKICPLLLVIKTWGESDLVDDMINGLEGNTQMQTKLKDAKSIIHMTMFTKTKAILKNIIVKAPRLLDSFDSKGRSPLSYAAHIGYVEGVKLLLERHPHMEFRRDMDNDGSFPIHQAVKGGQVKIIKLLHPNICLLNSNRQNVLHVAAESGNTNVVRFLLKLQEFKELLNIGDDNGNTPLHLAVKGAHYKIVSQLTQEKHVIGSPTNKELLTPKDLFEKYVQDQCQKVPSRKQINLMDLMLKRVQGEKSLLCERIYDQGHSQKQTKIKHTESTKYNTSISLDGKLKLTNKERANTFLVVATLIITVSFTAAFTPPGDYKDDTGIPTLIRSPAFKLFIICNGFAFLFAVMSTLALIFGMIVEKLTDITLFIGGLYISVGILCMLLAFLAGSVDVQILSLMKPKDSRWKWLIVRRMVEILVVPFMLYLIFLCRNFKQLSELRIRYLLRFCSEEIANLDFTI